MLKKNEISLEPVTWKIWSDATLPRDCLYFSHRLSRWANHSLCDDCTFDSQKMYGLLRWFLLVGQPQIFLLNRFKRRCSGSISRLQASYILRFCIFSFSFGAAKRPLAEACLMTHGEERLQPFSGWSGSLFGTFPCVWVLARLSVSGRKTGEGFGGDFKQRGGIFFCISTSWLRRQLERSDGGGKIRRGGWRNEPEPRRKRSGAQSERAEGCARSGSHRSSRRVRADGWIFPVARSAGRGSGPLVARDLTFHPVRMGPLSSREISLGGRTRRAEGKNSVSLIACFGLLQTDIPWGRAHFTLQIRRRRSHDRLLIVDQA